MLIILCTYSTYYFLLYKKDTHDRLVLNLAFHYSVSIAAEE